jgi:tetratricopeptide (TPR) repeat protein
MRLHYREGNSGGVANQFSKLNDPSVPDTLRFHAYYYMGLQHIRDKEYQKAIQLLSLVPENHPEYAFAQHSLAVAYALTDNLSMSIEALDNVIQVTPKTKEQTEVINRSFIFLGYIFYEGLGGQERSLSRAISALRKVPSTSYYYEDALIGIAWTALRASQWVDCIAASDQIIAATKKSALQCEAMLLKGYCAMIDKKYQDAVAILTPAAEKLTKEAGPSENDKNAKTLEFDNNRGVYYEISAKMNNLALTSQSSFTLTQIDSLHMPQMEYEKKLRDYYIYGDEFMRGSFFARNADNVRNDVEYALAKAEKMAGMKGAIKATEQAKEKVEKIDEEMQKLQDELKKLEQENQQK